MPGASIVAPGHSHVVPLEPEFIVPQDGAEKQDREKPRGPSPAFAGAGCWLAAHGEQYIHLKPIWLGDDLFAHQPPCEAARAAGGNFPFVREPSAHSLIQEYISGVALESHTERVKHGRIWVTPQDRWISGVPLRDGKDALIVNWLGIETVDATGKVNYRDSFVTD